MLRLHPKLIGIPDWRELTPDEPTTTLTQWYNVRSSPKRWENVPWWTKDRFLVRLEGPNYREPITGRAKRSAVWAAAPKWFRTKILRQQPK